MQDSEGPCIEACICLVQCTHMQIHRNFDGLNTNGSFIMACFKFVLEFIGKNPTGYRFGKI